MFPCSHCGRTFPTFAARRGHLAAVKAAATKRGQTFVPPRQTAAPPPHHTTQNPPLHCASCGVVFPAGTVHRCAAPPPPQTPPPTTAPPPNGRAFHKLPTLEEARFTVLTALEDLFALQCKATGISDEKRSAFDKYKKALAYALGPINNQATKNEADTALRVATIQLVKVTF